MDVPMRIALEGEVRAHFLYHDGTSLCERSPDELRILTRAGVGDADPILLVCGACLAALTVVAREAPPPEPTRQALK